MYLHFLSGVYFLTDVTQCVNVGWNKPAPAGVSGEVATLSTQESN